jgi:hypothetical protein
LPVFQDETPSESYFGGVGVLSSGNIVAGGSTTIDNDRFCWLVKVTPDGCIDTIFCQSVGAEGVSEVVDVGIHVYPNPSNGYLFVAFPAHIKSLNVTISALNGQAMFTATLDAIGALYVSGVPPGIYLFSAVTDNGTRFYQKLVLSH